jgi:hypothetical protein
MNEAGIMEKAVCRTSYASNHMRRATTPPAASWHLPVGFGNRIHESRDSLGVAGSSQAARCVA